MFLLFIFHIAEAMETISKDDHGLIVWGQMNKKSAYWAGTYKEETHPVMMLFFVWINFLSEKQIIIFSNNLCCITKLHIIAVCVAPSAPRPLLSVRTLCYIYFRCYVSFCDYSFFYWIWVLSSNPKDTEREI